MTGAADGAGSAAHPGWRWDVALSFAGAQRDYVEQVAHALKARGVRCFYDADEQIELWGKYLAEELPVIFGEQAAAVVVFVSAEYAAQDWTRHERRAALARAVRERREYVLPARFDDTPLPGLLSDMVTVSLRTKTPEQFAAMVAGKLAGLGIAPTGGATGDAGPARPAGAVRVTEADPRRLGVHAAISVQGVPDNVLPEYVPRDVDADEFGVRARVAAAAERGGFVLLVGGSSVGKTRCAAEAVRALLPEWWLVHPAGPAEVAALARTPVPRTLVWLDELQRYLDGEFGLTGAVVRELLNAPHPAVIIGTLWPDRYTAYTALPESGGPDPHAKEREVLHLATVIRIGPQFSSAEQGRARVAAGRDPRLRVALESAGYGLTQTLAAAPQLVARWRDAQTASPYAWAVLTAALDAARLGGRAPLTGEFLRAAAPGYCSSQQQAEAPEDWFEQALAYGTGKVHGAAAALSSAGAGMGRVVGYTAADYLIQHATMERRHERVPASTWDAVLSYVRDPVDTARLADSARSRLLYRYAIPLYCHAADAGDENAAWDLADLLAWRGDLDGLRTRAGQREKHATMLLADLLAERGDLDGLRVAADAGNGYAAEHAARLLEEIGDRDGAEQILRAAADAGYEAAAEQLASLLAERGDLDGLRAAADAGDGHAAFWWARLLAERGDLDGLRAAADAGDGAAVEQLARLLEERGDRDGAEQVLRVAADAGDWVAGSHLADLLAARGDLDGLRARADAGDQDAAWSVARALAGRGDLDGLRARAVVGDVYATEQLARLLAERGDFDGAEQMLRARADAGDTSVGSHLAELLAKRGDLEALRARADVDDWSAAWQLARLLAGRGDLDGLRARANAGDQHAGEQLADLLAERGDLDGLRTLADAGHKRAGEQLAKLLDNLLTEEGRGLEAERLRWSGLNPDGSIGL